jgi:hypothetical protein
VQDLDGVHLAGETVGQIPSPVGRAVVDDEDPVGARTMASTFAASL